MREVSPEIVENVPYLARKVPYDLQKLFARARTIDHGTLKYSGPVSDLIRSESYAIWGRMSVIPECFRDPLLPRNFVRETICPDFDSGGGPTKKF